MIADASTTGAVTSAPLIVKGLEKSFGRLRVLRGVDLVVPPGAIYGLVGLNGAGKTTALECLLGLQPSRSGLISILGTTPDQLATTGGRLGVVFDSPSLHPHLTVRQMLRHARILCRRGACKPAEVEGLLGLESYRNVRVRKLSLGNKRRASIAQALVGRPELVILDEPFSGLDAGGVDDLLELIRRLNRENGATFLLSSHQLAYLERISTHMAILHGGRIERAGAIDELLSGRRSRVWIRANDASRAAELLRESRGVASVEIDADERLVVEIDGEGSRSIDAAALNRKLVKARIDVTELVARPPTLDSLFRETVGRPNVPEADGARSASAS